MKPLRTLKRRLTVTLIAFGLASLALVHDPRPASAQMTLKDVETAVQWIIKAYGWYTTGRNILNPAPNAVGPNLAQELDVIRAAIFAELRTQRNQQWRADADTVAINFKTIALSQVGDPVLPSLWSDTSTLSGQTLNHFYEIVRDANDFESAYHLGPAFNTLQVAETGLRAMRGLHFGFPATWWEFHFYLQRAMQVNYWLVGSPEFLCWPGGNPGKHFYGNQSSGPAGGWYGKLGAMRGPAPIGTTVEDLVNQPIPRSQMWRWLGRASVSVGVSGYDVSHFDYNIGDGVKWGTGQCKVNDRVFDTHNGPYCVGDCFGAAGIKVDGRTTKFACDSTQCYDAPVACRPMIMFTAQLQFKLNTFDKDPNVQLVQAAMRAISHLGGGDERFDQINTTLPTQGQMVDPFVGEDICIPSPGNGGLPDPWAYPNDPDPNCAHGIMAGGVCCDAACGTCGGSDCSKRPGGSANCCTGTIKARGVSCGQSGAPCTMGDPTCETGVLSSDGAACCLGICGRCGGTDCGRRFTFSSISGADACCVTDIRKAGRSCATNPPPCVMP